MYCLNIDYLKRPETSSFTCAMICLIGCEPIFGGLAMLNFTCGVTTVLRALSSELIKTKFIEWQIKHTRKSKKFCHSHKRKGLYVKAIYNLKYKTTTRVKLFIEIIFWCVNSASKTIRLSACGCCNICIVVSVDCVCKRVIV